MLAVKELTEKYGILEVLENSAVLNKACPVAEVNTQFSPQRIADTVKTDPEELIKSPLIWQCLTCGSCKESSNNKTNMSCFIRDIRSLASAAGFKGTETHGGSIITAQRMCSRSSETASNSDWIPDTCQVSDQKGEYLYWTGNAPLFAAAMPRLADETQKSAVAAIRLLNYLKITPVILRQYHSSGHDLLWTGDTEHFQKCVEKNCKAIRETEAKKIIVSSAEDYYTLAKDYKEFTDDFPFEVCHITEIIADNIGKFKFDKRNATITYHDPCRLGRGMGVYDAPRRILAAIPGVEIEEMKNTKESSRCCGTSCWTNCNKYSKLMQLQRLQEAADTGADTLVTSCWECAIHFRCALHSSAWQQVSINVSDISVFTASLLQE